MKLFIERSDGKTLEFESDPDAVDAVIRRVCNTYSEIVRISSTVALRRSSIVSVFAEDSE